jgi:hypothetical protein
MRTRALKYPSFIAANVAAEPCGLLVIENHQLGNSLGIANCLLVIRDGLLGLGRRQHMGNREGTSGEAACDPAQ